MPTLHRVFIKHNILIKHANHIFKLSTCLRIVTGNIMFKNCPFQCIFPKSILLILALLQTRLNTCFTSTIPENSKIAIGIKRRKLSTGSSTRRFWIFQFQWNLHVMPNLLLIDTNRHFCYLWNCLPLSNISSSAYCSRTKHTVPGDLIRVTPSNNFLRCQIIRLVCQIVN